jgi:hypothetical protein
MSATDTYEAILARAREAGEAHGRAAGSWYFDGNTSEETYAAVLRGIEDGDPAVLDTFPCAPLSGEWADDPTPESVLEDLGVTWENPCADDCILAYEEGFYEASADGIAETARRMAPVPDPSFDTSCAYSVAGYPGIAFRVEAAYVSHVLAYMIGDDAEHRIDREDLTPIADEDYCGGCGQIGCSWH